MPTNQNIQDPREVGVGGLQGLNSRWARSAKEFQQIASQINQTTLPIEGIGLQYKDSGFGDSVYDKNITFESQLDNLNELRANEQPWYSQIANGLAKGVVLAGTTFLDGTLGLLFGAGNALAEGRWSALWDNDFSKAMQSVNEWSEQAMPNYYTQQEQEGPWYENIFTANFLGDKFLKNLGFTVGAFYSGGLEAGLIKGAGRALASAAKTAEAVKNITKATDMVASGIGSITSAVNEGRIEALNNSTDWYNTQKELITQAYNAGQIDDTQYAEALAKANEDRLHMGNADLLMNLPILTASNLIQFGKMYANGMKTAKKELNIVGKPGEYLAGSGKGKNVFNAVKGALSEGVEEISQGAASRIAGNYYATDVNNFLQSKIDPDASQETLDWVKAFAQGINETVNDGSAWEEFFIGSLTGALGMPRARAFKNAEGKWQSPITIEGGMYNELRESRERRIREQEVADYMNNRFNSPEFKNYYQGLIRHNKYQNDMNQAVEEDDPFNFHNAEHAQLLSDIMMFDKAGKMQDLVEMVNGAFSTDDANLEAIARNTQVDGNGPFMDNGNPKYSTEEGKKEMISQLEENKNAILDTIESYRKAKEDINNDLPAGTSLSDDQMEELAWIKTQIDNWDKRAVSMSGTIKEALGKVIGDIEGGISIWSAIRSKEGMEHADLTEKYKDADAKINLHRIIVNAFNAARNLSDEVLASRLSNGSNTEFLQELKKQLGYVDESIMSKDEKAKITKQLDDIEKLGNGKQYFAKKYLEYVTNPGKQLAAHQKAADKAAEAEDTKENLKKKDFIDNTDVSSLVKAANAGEIDLNDLDSLVKADSDSDVKDERTDKIEKALGIIDELNALQDRLMSVANEMGVDPSIVRDAEALLQKQQENIEDASQLADVSTEVFNDIENLVNTAEDADEASLNQRLDTVKALVKNADQRLAADREALDGLPAEIPEALANADETTPEVGHDSVTPGPAVNGTSDANAQDTAKPAYIQEALKDIRTIMPNIDTARAEKAARKLGQVYEKLHSVFQSQGTISASFGNILAADTSFKEVAETLGDGNANLLLANRIKKYTNPQPQAQSDSQVSNPQPHSDRLTTPDISDTNALDTQLDKENTRDSDLPSHDSTSASYNYWKRTTSEFYIHPGDLPRGQWLPTPEWADRALQQGKITPQQARRIKAVHKFLSNHNTYDSINNGEVTINTKDATKSNPQVHFVTSKELNTDAGEVVILIVSEQGRIIGDLGSKNDRNTHKQVGLLDFIAKAEQEYYKKKDSNTDDLVPLSGSTSVLQNLIGSPKYTARDDRRTLNEIWEGKEFKLAVAASGGQNADMLMSGRSLKAGKTDEERSVISPLDAKAGQPYVLVTTSSMGRHYYPVPFTMPKFSPATKNSSLGKAIQAIVKAGVETRNWEVIKGNAAKGYPGLPELLGVDKVSVSFTDDGYMKLGIQLNGTWHNSKISLNDPTIVDKMVDAIANIGIPFQISRKYLNGVYGPTGQSYNQMIGELAQTNLPVGGTHTVGEWFTLNPIGSDSKEQRGSQMRPTGVNPGTVARESRQGEIEVSVDGFTYYVDLAGNKVRSATGEFTGTLADTCIAKARCIKQGWDGVSHNIYKCGIGWFDPILNKWVPKPADAQEPTTTIETPSVPQTTADNSNLDNAIASLMGIDETATPEDIPQEALPEQPKREAQQPSTEQKISQVRANLLGEQEEIFDAMTPEQQAKLAAIDNEAMINTIMDSIEVEIWDNGEFTGDVDSYLDSRFSLEETRDYDRKWNEKKEMAWLRKALPQLSSVEIARTHNGLIKVGNSTYAYGMFKNGIITIAEAAARGTLYHEAFHAVTWTLFTDAERKELFDEAKKQYGISNDLETEERLAEDFRKYVQVEETPVVGKIIRFFRRLKHMINGLLGREQYLDKVFYSINRGLYAGRQVNTTNTTRLNKYTAEEEEILRNAPRDSEGRLLAPNGKPSNLTERQYAQVRTRAFKDWFGDWIGNPFAKNVSLGAGTFNADNADMSGYRPEFPFFVDGKFAGSFHFENLVINRDGENITDNKYLTFPEVGWALELEPEFRGKGYGKAMYYEAAKVAARKGRSLRSASLSNMSDDAKHVWDSLVKNGYARLEDNHYVFNNEKLNYSKVVNENGEPLVVYRASRWAGLNNPPAFAGKGDYTVFDKSKNSSGFFFTNKKSAEERYTGNNLRAFFLNSRNPDTSNNFNMLQADREYSVGMGYDAVLFSPDKEGVNGDNFEIKVFEPNQIKSATDNIGTFDPNNPDIRYRLVDNEISETQHEIDLADQAIKEISNNWNKARKIAHRGRRSREGKITYYSIGGAFNNEDEAQDYINRNIPEKLRGFFYAKQYMASAYIYYTENHAKENYDIETAPARVARKDAEERLARLKRERESRISDEALENQERYRLVIDQHHREKLEYGNLTDEQKEYLEMRKVSREEYNRLDDFEREVLFHCMGI